MIDAKKAWKLKQKEKLGKLSDKEKKLLDEYRRYQASKRAGTPPDPEKASGGQLIASGEDSGGVPPEHDQEVREESGELPPIPEAPTPPPINVPAGQPSPESPPPPAPKSPEGERKQTPPPSEGKGPSPQEVRGMLLMAVEGAAAALMKMNLELAEAGYACFDPRPVKAPSGELLPSMAEMVIGSGFKPALMRLMTTFAPTLDPEVEDALTVAGIGGFLGVQKFRLGRARRREEMEQDKPEEKTEEVSADVAKATAPPIANPQNGTSSPPPSTALIPRPSPVDKRAYFAEEPEQGIS